MIHGVEHGTFHGIPPQSLVYFTVMLGETLVSNGTNSNTSVNAPLEKASQINTYKLLKTVYFIRNKAFKNKTIKSFPLTCK